MVGCTLYVSICKDVSPIYLNLSSLFTLLLHKTDSSSSDFILLIEASESEPGGQIPMGEEVSRPLMLDEGD